MDTINNDVLETILLIVDTKDVLRMCLVCKSFKNLIANESLWKKKLQADFSYQMNNFDFTHDLSSYRMYRTLHAEYYRHISIVFGNDYCGRVWIGWDTTVSQLKEMIGRIMNLKGFNVVPQTIHFDVAGYVYHKSELCNTPHQICRDDKILQFSFDAGYMNSSDIFANSKLLDEPIRENKQYIYSDNGTMLGGCVTNSTEIETLLSFDERPVISKDNSDRLEFFRGKFVILVSKYRDHDGMIHYPRSFPRVTILPNERSKEIYDLYREGCN